MVKTKGPLLGLAASGTLANIVNFSENKGRSYARKKPNTKPILTTSSTSAKQLFGFLGGVGWASLTPAQQQMWAEIAAEKNTTPLNEFIREGMTHLVGAGGPTQEPGQTTGGTAPFTNSLVSIDGGVGQMVVTYALFTLNDGWAELPLLNSPNVAAGQTLTYPWWLTTLPGVFKVHTIKNVPAGIYTAGVFSMTTRGLFTSRGSIGGILVT